MLTTTTDRATRSSCRSHKYTWYAFRARPRRTDAWGSSDPPLFLFVQPSHPRQVFRRVHRHRPEFPHPDLDRDAVPERAKLFEAFGALEIRLRQAGETLQHGSVEAVEPDVRQRPHFG